MKSWQVWAGILVIFLSGIVIGIVGSAAFFKHEILVHVQEGPPAMRRFVVNVLTRELDLNEEQTEKITPIITDAQKEMLKIRASVQPQVKDLIGKTIEQLDPVLTPEQQTKLHQMNQLLESRWAVTLTNGVVAAPNP